MGDLARSIVRGTRTVFEKPGLAATLYMAALVSVFVTISFREED